MSLMTPTASHFPASVGAKLKAGQYEIVGMLGEGRVSATYCVRDNKSRPSTHYFAAKILDHEETQLHLAGLLLECDFLEAIANDPDDDADWFLPKIYDSFLQQAKTGIHLCFVMSLLGTDVDSFRRLSPTKTLYPYVVRNIIMRVAEALDALHRLGIIHTDVKPNNILFEYSLGNGEVERHLGLDATADRTSKSNLPLVPSPLSPEWRDMNPTQAETTSFRLIDLGSAQWSKKPRTAALFGAFALRAPELVLGADFDEKIDIWALGCVALELLTGRWAFHPEENGDITRDEHHLKLMMQMMGQTFDYKLLEAGRRTSEFFNENGQLLHAENLLHTQDIEARLDSCGLIHEGDIKPAAQFIRACLELDPSKRMSALDACEHPWICGAAGCCSVKSNWDYVPKARHEHSGSDQKL